MAANPIQTFTEAGLAIIRAKPHVARVDLKYDKQREETTLRVTDGQKSIAQVFGDYKDVELLKKLLGEFVGALANSKEKMEIESEGGARRKRRGKEGKGG